MEKNDKLVIVVDDEPTICRILKRILTKAGYQVITAPDGETALRLIEETKPDVILLDLMMPGINGREVRHKIRNFSPKIKVIYLTAKVESDLLALKELRSEADAFIAKPATIKQILSTVAKVLEGDRK